MKKVHRLRRVDREMEPTIWEGRCGTMASEFHVFGPHPRFTDDAKRVTCKRCKAATL